MAAAVDLVKLFSAASKALTQNQTALNEADSYNHDHGDHMVEIFDVITEAVRTKKKASPADQLEYASQLLRQRSQSGSGKVYAQNLAQAAQQFQGQKKVGAGDVGTLIQTLLGAGTVPAPQQGGGDLLGGLLSSLVGGGQSQPAQTTGGGGIDLGSLITSLTGAEQSQGTQAQGGGLDAGALLNAGLSYMQSKQQGKGDMEALINAVVGSSTVGQEPHRAQSGALITQAIMGLAAKALSKK